MEIILIILGVLLLVIVGAILYLASLDGRYKVTKSLIIKRHQRTMFAKIMDFESWSSWSPWLLHEPDAKVTYSSKCSEVGGSYSWDGSMIGAGKLTHERAEDSHEIIQKIEFTRPFRSQSKVSWLFENIDNDATKVTWDMEGQMPFLFRFMASSIAPAVGNDYELGLNLLNGVMDADSEHPQIEFSGITQIDDQKCLCKPFAGNMMEFQKVIESTYTKLQQQAASAATGSPFVAYHKVNLKKDYYELDFALPIADDNVAPGDFESKEILGGKFFCTNMSGDYRFIKLVWNCAFNHARMCKHRIDKNRPSLEIYTTNPLEVKHSNELVTRICLPIKT